MPYYPPNTGGGAPTTAEYLTGAADGTLSAERVVTDTTGNTAVTWNLATSGQAKANATNAGKWIKLATATASASATIDFTGLSSSYNAFLVILSDVAPATDAVNLWLRTSTNNGSSYDAAASDYEYGNFTVTNSGGTAGAGSGGAAQMLLTGAAGAGVGNASNRQLGGFVMIYRPSAAQYCRATWQVEYVRSDGSIDHAHGGGSRVTAADVDAIRFLMSSGNIASGQFDLYGLAV